MMFMKWFTLDLFAVWLDVGWPTSLSDATRMVNTDTTSRTVGCIWRDCPEQQPRPTWDKCLARTAYQGPLAWYSCSFRRSVTEALTIK